MAIAAGQVASVFPVGEVGTLIARLRDRAGSLPVALGIDAPIGLPRAYAARHAAQYTDFPSFLRDLVHRPGFFHIAESVDEIEPARPFYPRRAVRGMTRLSHATALGLAGADGLSRACDRATADRPAGAPLFWTLGANQSGRSAISAWRDLLLAGEPPALWPFHGPFRALLRPGRVVVAETYPAEALRQLGLRMGGSKRRQADRLALAPALAACLAGHGLTPDAGLTGYLSNGFGADPAGEDRFDCVLGLLCVLEVMAGRRPDTAPGDPWIQRWEGWVLGQHGDVSPGGPAPPSPPSVREPCRR